MHFNGRESKKMQALHYQLQQNVNRLSLKEKQMKLTQPTLIETQEHSTLQQQEVCLTAFEMDAFY